MELGLRFSTRSKGYKPCDSCIYEAILSNMLYVALWVYGYMTMLKGFYVYACIIALISKHPIIRMLVSLWFGTSWCLTNIFCVCGNLVEVGLGFSWL